MVYARPEAAKALEFNERDTPNALFPVSQGQEFKGNMKILHDFFSNDILIRLVQYWRMRM
jgi:hypothetical protein